MRRAWRVVLGCLATSACGQGPERAPDATVSAPDAAVPDASPPDASPPDASPPDASPPDARETVEIVSVLHRIGDDGRVLASTPIDESATSVSLLERAADVPGGFRVYAGQGSLGRLTVPGVPTTARRFYLRVGATYYATSARAATLEKLVFGRDATLTTMPTPVRLRVNGMYPWQPLDSIDLVGRNAYVVGFGMNLIAGATAPEPGAAALDMTIDWPKVNVGIATPGTPLFDGALGDRLTVVHFATSTSPTGVAYGGVKETSVLPSFTLTDGTAAVVMGDFTNRTRSGVVHFTVPRGQWDALRVAANPTIEPGTFGLSIAQQPGSSTGAVVSTPVQPDNLRVGVGAPYTDLDLGEMTYVPLDPDWGEFYSFLHVLTMRYQLPGTTNALSLFGTAQRGALLADERSGALAPLISPVRNARVNGVSLFTPARVPYEPQGPAIALTFDAPALGTAALYRVTVNRLFASADGASTRRTAVSTIYLDAADHDGVVWLPAMAYGQPGSYYLEIRAFTMRADTTLPTPVAYLGGAASVYSGILEVVTPPASCLEEKQRSPAASDGVYPIDPDGPAGVDPFLVYCDMTTAGGGWTLTARWTGVAFDGRTHAEVCGAAGNVRTATTDAAAFPVPPDDRIAAWGTTCLVKPGHPQFVASYGAWFTYPTGAFDAGAPGPVNVTYAQAGTVASSSAWMLWQEDDKQNFSVIPAVDNQGLCGGPLVCASMACPSTRAWTDCHWDQVNIQQVFRR